MRIGVLTSVETRHRYFANRLRAEFNVGAVAYEETGYSPAAVQSEELTPEEARIVADHFAERARQEEIFFGDQAAPVVESESCAVRHVRPGELNSESTLRLLESAGVDTVAVFGTNLIKPPLLGRWPGRMVNLHLGLSPYYRGTGTNFYPLLNEEPEYVGATIHLLDSRIDGGPILKHARPTIVADDMPHTIGCKAIKAGIDKMITVLGELAAGRLMPVPQWEVPNPRLYLRRDYHPRQVVELYKKIEQGLIHRYVAHAAELAGRVQLIE
jgi:folate-dependent phosphoribosylglycinamide formyltransferase PurN